MADNEKRSEVETVRQQQHTGNHDKPGPERGGSDRHGGTRHGADNIEPAASSQTPEEKAHGRRERESNP
jgi:hypothetical protein